MQNTDLNAQIVKKLTATFEMIEQGQYLRGRCPECSKKTLWTWLASPGHVECNRKTNCGYEDKTRAIFPELFEKLNERYKPTEQNPNATADAYLSLIRGFNPADIKGWYEQGHFSRNNASKNTATVRFYLDEAKQIMWERLIDDVIITDQDGDKESRNKNFKGSFKGLWWQPPTLQIDEGDDVYLCEGILDAIALNLSGVKAVAIMSSGTFPSTSIKPYLNKNITWVLAVDNDRAGRQALEKHSKKLRDMRETVTGALTSKTEDKADWNDLYKAGKLTEKDINEYRYLGRVELANNSNDKAQMIWEHNENNKYFVFSFGNRTYSCSVKPTEHATAKTAYWAGLLKINPESFNSEELEKAIKAASPQQLEEAGVYAFARASTIVQIATFKMDYLYFQQPDNGEDGQYFFSFRLSSSGQERQIAFTHKSISAASDFKKSSMRIPGAQFTGSTADLDWLYRDWSANNTKEVRTLDFVGYDKDSKTYVFNDYAVEGHKVHKLNNQSFFQLRKQGIKTTVDIKQSLTEKVNHEWTADFQTAFGVKGIVALSWWFGCLFAEQVRKEHRSYPFFELVGEAASGKSSLVDFMWKLYGKEGESFNPNSSTLAGRTRKMAEVSNLPIVFNETDNETDDKNSHVKRFNWDEQKDLYDGEFGRVTGVKSQDNSTKKPSFKAGLMIVQNVPVVASEAILTRICHMDFTTSHHTPAGYEASVRLNTMDIKKINGFVIHAARQADRVLKYFEQQLKKHRLTLSNNKDIKLQRIVENHAKVMAFADCLLSICPEIDKNMHHTALFELEEMAVERQASLNEDSQFIQQFWGQFDYLDNRLDSEKSLVSVTDQLNHSNNPKDEIAVNLEDFHSKNSKHNLPTIDAKELRRQLRTSKKREYKENGPVTSKITGKSVRCWIFKK